MKKITCWLFAAFSLCGSAISPLHATVVDFADLSLSPDTYHINGSFSSQGAGFNNSYSSYGSWGGFSYSNKTDSTTPGYTNQYSAITGMSGSGIAGGVYAVAYQDFYTPTTPRIDLPLGLTEPVSMRLTNTTYTFFSIRDGDSFTTAFAQGDWFKVIITGYGPGNAPVGNLDFYLADYRSSVVADHYVVNTWTDVNLSALGTGVSYLTLEFASSDTGAYGINTPTYVAVGNLVAVPEPSTVALVVTCALLGSGIARIKRRGNPPTI